MLPIKLELENFMSYDQATLEFDFGSALIVGQTNGNERVSNGSGKSTILNAVEWALFGESRNKTADNVVRRGQAMCRVCFVFSHDDHVYRVVRTRSAKNSKMEVQFEELRDDGSSNDLTHDTNRATDAAIKRVIKSTHEVFINSSYFRQNSFFDFVQGTFSTRQAIIGSMLNLDKWTKYQEEAKETLKDLTEQVERYKIEVDQLPGKTARLKQVMDEADFVEVAQAKCMRDETVLLDEIRDLESKATENKDSAANYRQYRELEDRLTSNETQIQLAKQTLANRQQTKEKLRLEADGTSERIKQLTELLATAATKLAAAERPDVQKFESAILDGKSQSKVLAQQIDNLTNNDACLMCGHEWFDQPAKQAGIAEREIKLQEIEAKLQRAQPKLAAIKAELAAVHQLELEVEKLGLQKNRLASTLEVAELKKQAAHDEMVATEGQVEALEKKRTEIKEALKALELVEHSVDLTQIEATLKQKRTAHQQLRQQLTQHSYRLGSLAQEQKSLQEAIQHLDGVKASLAIATRQASIYGQLAKAFSRDGIQAIIVDNIVEELSQTANYWLGQLWTEPVYINFITQKRNTKGDWRETFDLEFHTPTGTCQFEDFSGGEQFRISFAIRLALSIVQAKRMGGEIQLLMLDEVSTSLDPSGLDAFVSIIRRLEKEMKVLVISHDDKLKEEFEHVITVHKTPDGSTLTQN